MRDGKIHMMTVRVGEIEFQRLLRWSNTFQRWMIANTFDWIPYNWKVVE